MVTDVDISKINTTNEGTSPIPVDEEVFHQIVDSCFILT